jgi:carbonic anhydrase
VASSPPEWSANDAGGRFAATTATSCVAACTNGWRQLAGDLASPSGSRYREFLTESVMFVEGTTVSTTDQLLENNAAYAAAFDKGDLPLPPGRKVAVVACMDARLNPYGVLGLEEGQAHVIRNAGGVVTDDVVRSLAISQRLLGTEEIILVHHTDCGMLTFTDDEFKRAIQDDVGIKPTWSAEAFPDLDEDVRQSIARIKASPYIPRKESVRGFVYDVHTGKLDEVT